MYEQASERWSPVQSVEKVILSVISMLAGASLRLYLDLGFTLMATTEPNLESGANIDCCKLYRDNRAVSTLPLPSIAFVGWGEMLTRALRAQEYERIVRNSVRQQLGL